MNKVKLFEAPCFIGEVGKKLIFVFNNSRISIIVPKRLVKEHITSTWA